MRSCSICDKGYKRANSRSHSNRATLRKLQVNLQWTKVNGRRLMACTRCIRTTSKRSAEAAA